MSEKPVPSFRPIASPLDVDDAALERINEKLGVPAMMRPSAGGASVPAPLVRAPLEKLTLEVPDYVGAALRREAAEKRSSVRHLVMLALRNSGYAVEEVDMVPDGRRARNKMQ